MSGEAASVAGLLDDASARLAAALGLERREARLEARVLAGFAWKVAPAWLIAHDSDPVTGARLAEFQSLLSQRLQGIPVAYLVGAREFYGRPFQVTPDVLIPRPDTELLVEAALRRLPEGAPCSILDLGAGSGAVAVTLALERPLAQVVAVDASPAALGVARANARSLGARNVECVAGNWYAGLGARRFDLIVSNPPYVAATDPHLDAGDLRFEPRQALAAGADGLDDLRIVVAGATAHLKEHGWLFVEHGFEQAAAVARLLEQAGFEQRRTLRDLAGLERVSGGRSPG